MYWTRGTRPSRVTLLSAAVLSWLVAATLACLVFVQAAWATDYPLPQMATTKPPSGVTSTTAVLNGSIDTGGSTVTWYYQYGPTQSYGSSTPAQKAPAGQRTVNVPWTLLGLRPLTFYHYRLVVTESGFAGQSLGSDEAFLTAPTGFVFLPIARLRVAKRTVGVPLSCASQRRCTGRFRITTVARGKTVVCDSSPFRLKPRGHLKVKVKLSGACKSLIKRSRRHRLKAKFTLMPSSSQFGLVDTITLTL